MVQKSELSLYQRIIDAVLQTDSNPEHISQVLHYRGCSMTQPLEVMCAPEEDVGLSLFQPLTGSRGGVVKQCPECGAKREFFD